MIINIISKAFSTICAGGSAAVAAGADTWDCTVEI